MKVAKGESWRTTDLETITAKELIEALEDLDPDTPVVFTSNYGDRSRTQQIHPIQGKVKEEVSIEESAYSNSGWAVVGDREYYDEEPDHDTDEVSVCVIQ